MIPFLYGCAGICVIIIFIFIVGIIYSIIEDGFGFFRYNDLDDIFTNGLVGTLFLFVGLLLVILIYYFGEMIISMLNPVNYE